MGPPRRCVVVVVTAVTIDVSQLLLPIVDLVVVVVVTLLSFADFHAVLFRHRQIEAPSPPAKTTNDAF